MAPLMRATLVLLLSLTALVAAAQDLVRIAARHARIHDLYAKERYAEVVREVDAQLQQVNGTPYADSLHRYLYKYGRAHRKLKDAAAGTAAAERIYALVAQRGNAANELEALFDLSWTYYDVGEMKQCARVDSLAVRVADGGTDIPLAQRGRARQYLAFDHSIIGDHARSAHWALAALEVYAKADSIPPVQWAESHTAVGAAYWHLGRIRAAEEQYLKALEVLGDATDEATLMRKVSTHGNLGVLWQNAGDLPRAKMHYHTSLRLCDRIVAAAQDPFARDEAVVSRSRSYLNLATVYFQLGDEGHARELLQLAWKDRSSVLEADDPQLLSVRDRMAELELAQGSLDQAEQWVGSYVTACAKKFGTHSEEYLRGCSTLGEIAQRKGQYARADSLFRIAIGTSERKPDEGTDAVLALTLQRRATLATEQGRYADALADLARARVVVVNTYDSAHFKVAAIDIARAETSFRAGNAAAALQAANSALHLLRARVSALRADRAPKTFHDPHLLPDALYWKVRAQRALHGHGAPDPQWNADLDLAISALARNKAAVQDEASKLLLVGAQERLFDLAMDLAYEAYAAAPTEAAVERFLALSEADRATLLKARLNTFAGLRFAGVPDSVAAREQELLAALEVNEAERSSASDLDRHERAYAELLQHLEQRYPHYFQLRYGETPITLQQVRQRLLTPQRQLLAYARTGEHLYALVVSPTAAHLLRLPAAGLADAVRAHNNAIAQRATAAYVQAAHVLYAEVFAPVAAHLPLPELLLLPDAELHTVNFETLLDAPTTAADHRQHLLLQRYTLAYLLSATTAVQFAQLARTAAPGALAVAPGFDEALKQRYLASVPDSAAVDRDFLRFVRQPFAQRTAEGLRSLLSAKVMLGGDASEDRFRALAHDYGILHLGTHAEMNERSPMYSRLVLSKDGAGVDADADGYLHAYEIYELDLRAQLAVLTACETGTGRAEQGEGVRSLGYGFAYAGCPSLVSSLWSIDEQVSSAIITRFYEHLAAGLPKHAALRQAKLDHLATATDQLAQPYYWAGLVLVGDVEPLRTEQGGWRWWYLLVALGVGVLAWVWWGRRRRNK